MTDLTTDQTIHTSPTQPAAVQRSRRPLATALILLGLFLAAWLPRTVGLDVFVTADERKWLVRAANFDYALAHGDLYNTYQREHPAVTNTWLGGLGVVTAMPSYPQVAPGYFNPDIEEMEGWLKANGGAAPLAMLAWARAYTVLVVALVMALTFFPLRRLFGTLPAVLIALFVSWAPMTVGFTRQVQPDGLHSVFMYAAFVFFLSWLYAPAGQVSLPDEGLSRDAAGQGQATQRRLHDLVAAGILMGLGWLTKTPVLFLVPIGGLLLLVEWWRARRAGEPNPGRRLLLAYVLWGIVATATFFLLWPALWVDPAGIFVKMYREMTVYIEGHINPNFFMGQVTHDPGIIFYPVAVWFRTTPAALLGLVLLALGLWRRWPPLHMAAARRAAWALVAFVVLFTVFMTLPAKKFDRYLLPVFFMLDLLAGLGWATAALWVGTWLRARRPGMRWLPALGTAAVALLALLPLHAALTAQHAPYYMTYFNPLAGGSATAPQVMFVGWGEGLDEAGRWLDQQEGADRSRAVSWYAGGPLSYYYRGESVGVLSNSRLPWLDADYVVTYINQVQREIPNRAVVDYFARQTPVYTATIGGIDMAKVYDLRAIVASLRKQVPPPDELPAGQNWDLVRMKTLRTLPTVAPGNLLAVQTEWAVRQGQPEELLNGDQLKLSVRLVGPDDILVAQQDVDLTDDLKQLLFVPPDAPPGTYSLYVLVYHNGTLEPVTGPEGEQLAKLAEVEVRQ